MVYTVAGGLQVVPYSKFTKTTFRAQIAEPMDVPLVSKYTQHLATGQYMANSYSDDCSLSRAIDLAMESGHSRHSY